MSRFGEYEIYIIENVAKAELTRSELKLVLIMLKYKERGWSVADSAIAEKVNMEKALFQKTVDSLLDKNVLYETTVGLQFNDFNLWGEKNTKRHSLKKLDKIVEILFRHYQSSFERFKSEIKIAFEAGNGLNFHLIDDISEVFGDSQSWLGWTRTVDDFEDEFELIHYLEKSLLMPVLNCSLQKLKEQYNEIVNLYSDRQRLMV
ncbi:MAG: hypothetical protein MK078_18425 [Crocinitomicaceae bacterium]|nr:hypothetical protein [Crocinitomicaceae bacterium]|tara:strand:- start:2049 stop:2660 length:612 start_codon:yes stop_codon:yes gene_type:complete